LKSSVLLFKSDTIFKALLFLFRCNVNCGDFQRFLQTGLRVKSCNPFLRYFYSMFNSMPFSDSQVLSTNDCFITMSSTCQYGDKIGLTELEINKCESRCPTRVCENKKNNWMTFDVIT